MDSSLIRVSFATVSPTSCAGHQSPQSPSQSSPGRPWQSSRRPAPQQAPSASNICSQQPWGLRFHSLSPPEVAWCYLPTSSSHPRFSAQRPAPLHNILDGGETGLNKGHGVGRRWSSPISSAQQEELRVPSQFPWRRLAIKWSILPRWESWQ